MLKELVVTLLAVGCGGNMQGSDSRSNTNSGIGGVASAIAAGGGSGGSSQGSAGQVALGGSTCTPEGTSTFSSRIPGCSEGCQNACTFVVRLDYANLKPLGWSVNCGRNRQIDVSAAGQVALSSTGYGGVGSNLQTSGDLFVFSEPASDFGGVGIVSTLSGLALFGGSIVWSGRGAITYPTTWESPDAMGRGCGFASVGMPSADTEPPAAVVGRMAIANAFPDGPISVDTYLYTPAVGATDYSVAEWLVFVSGLGQPGM